MDGPVVAELRLRMKEKGDRERCSIVFHVPRKVETGDWACRAYLTGLHEKPFDIRGEDSLQALNLCMRFVGSLLKTEMTIGTRFEHDSPEHEPFNLDFYFPNAR